MRVNLCCFALLIAAISLAQPVQLNAQIHHGDGTVTLNVNGYIIVVITAKSFSCRLYTSKRNFDVEGAIRQISLDTPTEYDFSQMKTKLTMSNGGKSKSYDATYDIDRYAERTLQHYIIRPKKSEQFIFSFYRNSVGHVMRLNGGEVTASGQCQFSNLPFVDPRLKK